ncbi:MAG: molybdenum ABC transporter ATP-binding protein [Elsteraceae bacterium]
MTALIDVAVKRRIGGFTLDASFQSDARLTALFGRSGAGKTTVINMIAGLIRPDAGRVVIKGEVLVDVERGIYTPKHRRRVGYVFQDARLFPHLNVRQNLLYGRWFARGESGGMDLDQVVALLGLEPLLRRRPEGLSGGEKQRVAIGRALLARPRLLLMDEPFAALDETRKNEIFPYMERLRDETDTPIVYVSHALREVTRLAGAMALMDHGRVTAIGPPAALMARLGSIDDGSVLEGEVVALDAPFGLSLVRTQAGLLRVGGLALPIGAATPVHIPAGGVLISRERLEGVSALNQLAARVAAIDPPSAEEPHQRLVRLDCGGATLLARLTTKSVVELGLAPGQPVFAIIKSVSLNPLAEDR